MGLAKVNRLRSYRDFRQVYESGKKYESAHLIIWALLDSEIVSNEPKIGIVVSQKVSKKAVTRNRIKRQIKGIIRGLLPQIDKGVKIVIIVKTTARECQFNQFLRELKELLLKANIIHGN